MDEKDKFAIQQEIHDALATILGAVEAVNAAHKAIRGGNGQGPPAPTKQNLTVLRNAEKALSKAIDGATQKSKDDGKKGNVTNFEIETTYDTTYGVYINGIRGRAWVREKDGDAVINSNFSSSSSSSSHSWP